ncbi:hypothetical protein SESBI_23176 [Sesbania bispinosa]|nr:hypothetical protein SESBI_23176 [Sesbania bispinosa]
MASWDHMGELANVAQLTGIDAVRLIGMIVKAASTARMHKKNCRQFAQHLKLIGNLLETLKISELKRYPETREPLEQLEDALRRSYILVNSCQDRSYLYLLAMGWNIVYQFRKAQNEIDRYLRLVPLITLVDNARVRERLEVIEQDQREYTLDDEDQQAQDNVTEVAAYSLPEKCSPVKSHKKEEYGYSDANGDKGHSSDEKYHAKIETTSPSRFSVSQKDLMSTGGSYQQEDWHTDLLACCSEPYLCMKTFFYPCGTFSKIASVANNRPISPGEACNDLNGVFINFCLVVAILAA